MTGRTTVLVTGATGVVGAAVLPALGRHHVICLSRSGRGPGERVHGDLRVHNLGLAAADYRRLAARVDVVLHCAAVTDFAASRQQLRAVNEGGTSRVLDFARAAEARLVHVSTAFVGRQDAGSGPGPAGSRARTSADPSGYAGSKRVAEELVRTSGVRATVVRPSVVLGDSATGRIARFQGMHGLLGAILKSRLPFVPLDPATQIDAVPQDWVAAAIAALVADDCAGGTAWLTAGSAAPTAGRVLELCLQTADALAIPVTPPRLVRPEMVDRLLRPVFLDHLDARAQRKVDQLMALTALFTGAGTFPSSFGALPAGPPAPTAAAVESALVASVTHLAQVKGWAAGRERPAA